MLNLTDYSNPDFGNIPIYANNYWSIKQPPQTTGENWWKGSTGLYTWQSDITNNTQTIVKFIHPMWAARAFFRVMQQYSNRGIKTIQQIANEYAPSSDGNNNQLWAEIVSEYFLDQSLATRQQMTLVPKDFVLDLTAPTSLIPLAAAVTQIEVFKGFMVEQSILTNGLALWAKDFS